MLFKGFLDARLVLCEILCIFVEGEKNIRYDKIYKNSAESGSFGGVLGVQSGQYGGDFEASGVVYGGVSRQCYPNA